ncbi:MAG: L,D-transpeptidase [Bacteroidales bacterium]
MMKKRWWWILSLVLILLSMLTFAFFQIKEPPLAEINQARRKLAEAKKSKSSEYARELFQKASLFYDSASSEWHNQNERFILFRDYKKTLENAEKATLLATEALGAAKTKASSEKDLLGRRISNLRSKVHDFDVKYRNFPFNKKERNDLAKCKLLLNEGDFAFKQNNYPSCKSKIESAETLISKLHEIYKKRLEHYFSHYPKWQKWVDQSIAFSGKQKTYCIIVDKFARECLLYKNGKLQQSFEIELGPYWMGDKMQQGDKFTPEGLYKIVTKKANGNTKYYKAFLLDYPNEDDRKRFALNKKNGVVKKNANIGNLIEIHGNGGKGIDWTDGCVALKDADMDKLYKACPEGTRVTIVGSVKPLNKLF